MGKLDGKTICMFVEFNYEDLEIHYPLLRLEEEGAKVVLVSNKEGVKYTGKYGYPAISDKSIDQVSTKDFDALIIPGGYK
jgi:protease I